MAEARLVIDGAEHEVPMLSSFDMNEYQILFDLSGLTVMDFATEDEEVIARNYWNPGYQRTLLIVAYLRANPGAKRADAEKLIGRVRLADVIDKGDDAGPPDLTESAESPADPGSPSRNYRSGAPSNNASDGSPGVRLRNTGTGKSATSPDRDPELSEHGSRLI